MQYTRLGRTGLQVSRLCLGTMNFGWSANEKTSFDIMDAAFEAGINFFDTADIYSRWIEGNPGGVSESIIGRWLKTKNRRDVIIATKVTGRMWEGPNGEGLSRYHIKHAVEDSLRRLDTDYIDLYQAHWFDENTPIDETLEAFDRLVQEGKVLYIGASNYPAWRLVEALWTSDKYALSRFDTLQPNYSMFHRKEYEAELAEVCQKYEIGVIPYSPLAAGFATGKYRRDNTTPDTARSSSGMIQRLTKDEKAFDALEAAEAMARERGVPVAQIALAWMLAEPMINAPIIGARTVEQLSELFNATEIQLTAEEVSQLDNATDGF